ncbi:MAG: hypothetical protein J5762_00325 [Clostridia bacterium]|nr:hypothetical protein [Clostridia bacterium]
MNDEYLIVLKSILPEYFEAVIKAKAMVEDENRSVSEACKRYNISRSTYYKYKDKIFNASKNYGKKSIIGVKAGDKAGVLNAIITEIYDAGANIISINSAMPVKDVAFITIAMDVSDATIDTAQIIYKLKAIEHVKSASIISVE